MFSQRINFITAFNFHMRRSPDKFNLRSRLLSQKPNLLPQIHVPYLSGLDPPAMAVPLFGPLYNPFENIF